MYQALVCGLIWPLAGMEMSGPGANHSGELSSSMHARVQTHKLLGTIPAL